MTTQEKNSTNAPQLIVDKIYEFFSEVRQVIDKLGEKDPLEEDIVRSLQKAFAEAGKEFQEILLFSKTLFESSDNTYLRKTVAKQAKEIRQLQEKLTEPGEGEETAEEDESFVYVPSKTEPGLYALDAYDRVYGPYADETQMLLAFGSLTPKKTHRLKTGDRTMPRWVFDPPRRPTVDVPVARDPREMKVYTPKELSGTGDNAYEPPPKPSNHPAVWDLVMKDIADRDKFGEEKYGQRLKPFVGRKPLVDLYQELLDAVVYVKQEIYERQAVATMLIRKVEEGLYPIGLDKDLLSTWLQTHTDAIPEASEEREKTMSLLNEIDTKTELLKEAVAIIDPAARDFRTISGEEFNNFIAKAKEIIG